MKPDSIEELHTDFRNTFEKTPDFAIDFFKKNWITLNNINEFTDQQQLRLFIQLINRYLNALYDKDRFNETLDEAIRFQNLIDREISRLNSSELKDDWYYGILFVRGMSSYGLNDYKSSTPIFRLLMLSDPKNERYRSWFNYSRYGERQWLVNTIWIISGIFLFIDILFGDYLNSKISIMLTLAGLLLIIFNFSYQYYITRSQRKSNAK
jgi:hypothetical protein